MVLDLRALDSFTDYFVICSGQNARQVQAIADAIEEGLREEQREAGPRRGVRARRVGAARLLRFRRPRVQQPARASSTRSSGCGAARNGRRCPRTRRGRHGPRRRANEMNHLGQRAAGPPWRTSPRVVQPLLAVLLAPSCLACSSQLDRRSTAPSAQPAGGPSSRCLPRSACAAATAAFMAGDRSASGTLRPLPAPPAGRPPQPGRRRLRGRPARHGARVEVSSAGRWPRRWRP